MPANSKFNFLLLLFLLLSGAFFSAHAQSMLDTEMSVDADQKPLGRILDLMEQKQILDLLTTVNSL